MSDSAVKREPVEELAEDFAQRLRAGEHPSITDYIQRRPDLEVDIRRLFPAIAALEQVGQDERLGRCGASTGRVPEQLGEFRIIREIGRGGMGVVYEAEQLTLGRRVALKILTHAVLTDSHQRVRFENEARTAAKLHHTHIVPVIGVGECQGVPYYAMQHIRGESLQSLLHHATQLRSQGQRPTWDRATGASNDSSTSSNSGYFDSAARLAMQVADALHHAHSNGILHRDIKPANIMVDEQLNAWVTDFGLSKLGDSELTRPGELVGTLRYMAPERFSGQGDSRSDVYGLGLTLYEMVTLRPAFAASERAQLVSQVVNDPPPTPRSLSPKLPPDLQTIILKAIDKLPERRYQSAKELYDDLARFLARLPIHARKTTWLQRSGRWCRRNPALATSLMLLVVVFFSGFAGVLWQWRRADQSLEEAQWQTQRAEANLADKEIQARRAERNYRAANRVVDELLQSLVEHMAGNSVDLATLHRDFASVLERQRKSLELIEPGDPDTQLQNAEFFAKLVPFYRTTRQHPEALAAYEQAAEFLKKHRREHGDSDRSLTVLADLSNQAGRVFHACGRIRQASEAFGDAERLYRELYHQYPNRIELADGLAATLNNFSYLLAEEYRQYERAIALIREATELRRELFDRNPDDPARREKYIRAIASLSSRLFDDRQFDESIRMGHEALRTLDPLMVSGTQGFEYRRRAAKIWNRIGDAELRGRRQLDDSRIAVAYNTAIELQLQLIRESPANPHLKSELANSYVNLGEFESRNGRNEVALDLVNRAIAELESLLALTPDTLSDRVALAQARRQRAKYCIALNLDAEADSDLSIATLLLRDIAASAPEVQRFQIALNNSLGEWAELCLRRGNIPRAIELAEERRSVIANYDSPLLANARFVANLLHNDDHRHLLGKSEIQRAADLVVESLIELHARGYIEAAKVGEGTGYAQCWRNARFQELPPEFVGAWKLRAEQSLVDGNWGAAMRDLEACLDHAPWDREAARRLTEVCLFAAGDSDAVNRGLRWARRLHELPSPDADSFLWFAAGYLRRGQPNDAIRALESNGDSLHASVIGSLIAAISFARRGDLQPAREALNMADAASVIQSSPTFTRGTAGRWEPFHPLRAEAIEAIDTLK